MNNKSSIPLVDAAEFFLNLKTASAPVADPDMTGTLEGRFQAPVEEVLKHFRFCARSKLRLSMAYRVYSEELRSVGNTSLGEHFKEHSEDMLNDVDFFVRRSVVLGGPIELGEIDTPPPQTELEGILKTLIRLEQENIAIVRSTLPMLGDNPSKFELEHMLGQDQHHLDDMWQHLPQEARHAVLQENEKRAGKLKDALSGKMIRDGVREYRLAGNDKAKKSVGTLLKQVGAESSGKNLKTQAKKKIVEGVKTTAKPYAAAAGGAALLAAVSSSEKKNRKKVLEKKADSDLEQATGSRWAPYALRAGLPLVGMTIGGMLGGAASHGPSSFVRNVERGAGVGGVLGGLLALNGGHQANINLDKLTERALQGKKVKGTTPLAGAVTAAVGMSPFVMLSGASPLSLALAGSSVAGSAAMGHRLSAMERLSEKFHEDKKRHNPMRNIREKLRAAHEARTLEKDSGFDMAGPATGQHQPATPPVPMMGAAAGKLPAPKLAGDLGKAKGLKRVTQLLTGSRAKSIEKAMADRRPGLVRRAADHESLWKRLPPGAREQSGTLKDRLSKVHGKVQMNDALQAAAGKERGKVNQTRNAAAGLGVLGTTGAITVRSHTRKKKEKTAADKVAVVAQIIGGIAGHRKAHESRKTEGALRGIGGTIAGSAGGMALGSFAGAPGAIAGGLAGSYLGYKALTQDIDKPKEKKDAEKTAFSITGKGHAYDALRARVLENAYNDLAVVDQSFGGANAHRNEDGSTTAPSILQMLRFNSGDHADEARHQAYVAAQHEKGRNAYNPWGGFLTPSAREVGGTSGLLGSRGRTEGRKHAAEKSDADQAETGRQRAIANLASGFTSDKASRGERYGDLVGRAAGAAGGLAAGLRASKGGSTAVRAASGLGSAALGSSLAGRVGKAVGSERDNAKFWKEHGDKTANPNTAMLAAAAILGGYSPGRRLAGDTAAELAPHGRMGRSEDLARTVGTLSVPAGALAGMALAHKYDAANRITQAVRGFSPRGLLGSPSTDSALIHAATPAVSALLGSLAGGALTGVGVGGVQALRGSPKRSKEASDMLDDKARNKNKEPSMKTQGRTTIHGDRTISLDQGKEMNITSNWRKQKMVDSLRKAAAEVGVEAPPPAELEVAPSIGPKAPPPPKKAPKGPAIDPAAMEAEQMLAAEQDAAAQQEAGEADYFRQQYQQAQQELEALQAQTQQQAQELEQTQMELQQTHEQNGAALQQADMAIEQARQTAEQAMSSSLQRSQQLMTQVGLAANVRNEHQAMKEQLVNMSAQPAPAATINEAAAQGQADPNQATGMPQDPNAPPGAPPGGAAPPGADPNGGAPPQAAPQEEAAPSGGAAPAKPSKTKTAAVPGLTGGLIGAALGGAGSWAETQSNSTPMFRKAVDKLKAREQSSGGGFANSMAMARAKFELDKAQVAKAHPGKAALLGAGIGAGAGSGVEMAIRGLLSLRGQ